MSEAEDSMPVTEKKYGAKGSRGPWAKLDKETRERYEAIEDRVREKVRRGEL